MPFDRYTYWKEYKAQNRGRWQLKKTPIAKKPVKIKPISDKRRKQLREYEKEKKEYFELHTQCEFPGCEKTEITLHHMAGRIGDKLTDQRYFKALCWEHHRWIEEHPEAARRLGLSQSRLNKAS